MKRNDTTDAKITLTGTVRDPVTGAVTHPPADLTAATAITVTVRRGGQVLGAPRTLVGRPADGKLTLVRAAGDTSEVDVLNYEVQVTWPDGKIQTFPDRGFMVETIESDAEATP